jgi:hypothetical protein
MDICPFEGDPAVTCKSFLEPLPGFGTKMQAYGGNILNFIPHRVQVFSITNTGDSLLRIAAEAVLNRGRERARFELQANTSLSTVDEDLLNTMRYDLPMIQVLDDIISEIERVQADAVHAPSAGAASTSHIDES